MATLSESAARTEAADAGGATLVFECTDFSAVGDLKAASATSVSLSGVTWTITSIVKAAALGANGAMLRYRSVAQAGLACIYAYQSNRTSSYIHIPLSTIDPDGNDDDGYEIQMEVNAWPVGGDSEFLFVGFNATAGATDRDVLAGLNYSTGSRRVWIDDGYQTAATGATDDGTTRDVRVRCSGVAYGGVGEIRRSATPSAVIGNGAPLFVGPTTDAAAISGVGGSAVGSTRGCKRSVTSAVIAAYGKNASDGVDWDIKAIRIWRLARQT